MRATCHRHLMLFRTCWHDGMCRRLCMAGLRGKDRLACLTPPMRRSRGPHVARYPTRHGVRWRVLPACAGGGRLAAVTSLTVASVSGWDDNENAARSSHSQQWVCRRALTWGDSEWALTGGTLCTHMGHSECSHGVTVSECPHEVTLSESSHGLLCALH